MSFDPALANQGTAVLLAADQSVLAPGGMTIVLPRGMRVDPAARAERCDPGAASACTDASRIGFGRFVVAVRGFALGGGEAQVVWSLDAFLGKPVKGGDVASVVLSAKLLGESTVAALLTPALGTSVPAAATLTGRIVRRAGGVEVRFPSLPLQLALPAPASAAPARLELSLSAVRRVRENFVRRIKVRTLKGTEVRRIRDHRLVGHDLFRTPAACKGTWRAQLRAARTTAVRIGCAAAN